MKQGKQVGVYLTFQVYKLWQTNATAKEIAMYMLPVKTDELVIENYSKGDFIIVSFRMPMRWVNWYSSLDTQQKYAFAKIVEQRIREVGILE